jgi:hypothetical protein
MFCPARKVNWVQWLKDQNKPKEVTEYDILLDAVQSVGIELGKKYKWDSVEVYLGDKNVHMCYVTKDGLFYAQVPIQIIRRSLMILPYLEVEVQKMEKELLKPTSTKRKRRKSKK